MIDNTIDSCPATPNGEQVDSVGCWSTTMKTMMTFGTLMTFVLIPLRPSSRPKWLLKLRRSDQDTLVNADDEYCASDSDDENGCSLSQRLDGDGKNDEDKFPNGPNEWEDSDDDGITDRLDAYPQDATRSEAEEEDGNGFMFILPLFAIGIIGALLVVKNSDHEKKFTFAAVNYEDHATEANMAQIYESKAVRD